MASKRLVSGNRRTVVYLVIAMAVGMLASRTGGGTGIHNYFLGGDKLVGIRSPGGPLLPRACPPISMSAGTMALSSFIYLLPSGLRALAREETAWRNGLAE
jgi:hypothetical protein